MSNRASAELKEAKLYLGEENDKILSNLSSSEWSYLKELQVNPTKSYFVKGASNKLDMFRAYFLALGIARKPAYKEYLMTEYVRALSDPSDEDNDFLLGSNRELLILRIHNQSCGIGGTEDWMATSLISKVANRKIQGLTTLILSERNFSQLEKSGLFESINLGGAISIKSVEEAAERVKNSSKNNSGYA